MLLFRDGVFINEMVCYFPGWGVSKRDGILVNGMGVTFRDGVLVNGMGC